MQRAKLVIAFGTCLLTMPDHMPKLGYEVGRWNESTCRTAFSPSAHGEQMDYAREAN